MYDDGFDFQFFGCLYFNFSIGEKTVKICILMSGLLKKTDLFSETRECPNHNFY